MNDDILKSNSEELILMNYWRTFVICVNPKNIREKVLNIYTITVNYDPRMEFSTLFFKILKNKMY